MATDPTNIAAASYFPAYPAYSAVGSDNPDGGGVVDDHVLMDRLAPGDEHALITLYDRYASLVFSLSPTIVRNEEGAEEILHELFLRLWRGAKGYDRGRVSVTQWIAVMTRHLASDHNRKASSLADAPPLN